MTLLNCLYLFIMLCYSRYLTPLKYQMPSYLFTSFSLVVTSLHRRGFPT